MVNTMQNTAVPTSTYNSMLQIILGDLFGNYTIPNSLKDDGTHDAQLNLANSINALLENPLIKHSIALRSSGVMFFDELYASASTVVDAVVGEAYAQQQMLLPPGEYVVWEIESDTEGDTDLGIFKRRFLSHASAQGNVTFMLTGCTVYPEYTNVVLYLPDMGDDEQTPTSHRMGKQEMQLLITYCVKDTETTATSADEMLLPVD